MTSKHYRALLVCVVFIIWLWSVYNPLSYKDWFLENVIFFALLPVIYYVGKKFQLSDFSYTLIALYISIHLVGSHYTYGQVPFGEVLADWIGSERNMYDRLIHFSYGLLIYHPIRHIYLRLSKPESFLSYFFPFLITIACTSLYEIGEFAVASYTSLRVAADFISAQGDFFDAQKDTLMVVTGAGITWFATVLLNMRKKVRQIS